MSGNFRFWHKADVTIALTMEERTSQFNGAKSDFEPNRTIVIRRLDLKLP